MSNLKERFKKVSLSSDYKVVDIKDFGKVGLRKMSIADRNAWVEAGSQGGVALIQRTVCDPETSELSLKDVPLDELSELPIEIADALIDEILAHNNLTKKKDEDQEEGIELKN